MNKLLAHTQTHIQLSRIDIDLYMETMSGSTSPSPKLSQINVE